MKNNKGSLSLIIIIILALLIILVLAASLILNNKSSGPKEIRVQVPTPVISEGEVSDSLDAEVIDKELEEIVIEDPETELKELDTSAISL